MDRVDRRLVVDLGGGAGYFTEALVAAGARCILVEPEAGSPDDNDTPDEPATSNWAAAPPTRPRRPGLAIEV